MLSRLILIASFFLLLFGSSIPQAEAGLGITPPYVRNNSLTRGSHYEQKIIISRGDPVDDLKAKITMSVPGAESWFRIDRGLEFTLPKDAYQVPMVVNVDVPSDAKYGSYKGYIRVILTPDNPIPGTVGIALGAQIDVDIVVSDKKSYDFRIRSIQMPDLEVGEKKWGFFFPGKIRFGMQVENTGNIDFGPTKVELDIYDLTTKKLLEQVKNKNKIKKIKPFEIKNIDAELPTRLPVSAYKAVYRIYKFEEAVQSGEVYFNVVEKGKIPNYPGGYGFDGLHLREQLGIGGVALAILGGAGYGFYRSRSRRRHRVPAPPKRSS